MYKDVEQRRLVFFIDRIEQSSYPVTETGYAFVYRAWVRAGATGDEIYVVYPDASFERDPAGAGEADRVCVMAHRVERFIASPYTHYQSQRNQYEPGAHCGSSRCHTESATRALTLNAVDAVIWRQESGEPERMRAMLEALREVERDTVVYLSPKLALDPELGAKVLPARVDPRWTPKSFHTQGGAQADKVSAAVAFIRHSLAMPQTVVLKPLNTNNAVGVTMLGTDPVSETTQHAVDDAAKISEMIGTYGDIVVQEYIPSVRSPIGQDPKALAAVPLDRRDFGEIRFLLIDGELPRGADGRPCLVARRVPAANSLVADSGISYATSLGAAEERFLEQVGALYKRCGIYFGGGDLIRTPNPARPFVFTDAARSVCGHAVVTGALNGDPYLIVDQVLDNLDRHIALRGRQVRTAYRDAVVDSHSHP